MTTLAIAQEQLAVISEYVKTHYFGVHDAEIIQPITKYGRAFGLQEYNSKSLVIDMMYAHVDKLVLPRQLFDFYMKNGIKFFIMLGNKAAVSFADDFNGTTAVITNSQFDIIDGDNVNPYRASFITNLSPDLLVTTAPSLKAAIDAASKIKIREFSGRKEKLCKYCKPQDDSKISADELARIAHHNLVIYRTEAKLIKRSLASVSDRTHIYMPTLELNSSASKRVTRLR